MIIIKEDAASIPSDLLEKLAEIEHERWAGQAKTALTEMTPERRERWTILANTSYDDLSEEMKQKDREQVLEYWPIIAQSLRLS